MLIRPVLEVSESFHGGTGVVYTLANSATQIGFFVGPVGGSAIMQATSFQVMSLVLGGIMVLYAPAMLICRGLPQPGADVAITSDSTSQSEEDGAEDPGGPVVQL